MDLIDQIQTLANRIPKMIDHLQTEEATKHSLVMPFLAALGYNIFDPTEVVPEFTADVGTKKGEKVDYAILRDGQPIMLVECKAAQTTLGDKHDSQLYRYFSVTHARIAVLTNGIIYKFFADLNEPNKMDEHPFLEVDLLAIRESQIPALKRFTKLAFDIDGMLTAASELMYTKAIKQLFDAQLAEPSEDFVRFFISEVYRGRATKGIKDQFARLTKRALNEYIRERLNDRLKSALEGGAPPETEESAVEKDDGKTNDDGIETTDEEIEGFNIVRAILAETVDVSRIHMRDTKSYCGILLDDNNRKPICRLRFNAASKKYLGLFNADKNEEKIEIGKVSDIYRYADRIRITISYYELPTGN